jgi:hypothetical protein
VVGALGCFEVKLIDSLIQHLGLERKVAIRLANELQRIAILGSSRVIKNLLANNGEELKTTAACG